MKAGNAMALNKLFGFLMGLILVLGASPVWAQTPEAACAADSLYLISPDELTIRPQFEGRPGIVISWPDISLDEATCYTLTETDGLDFSVAVDGGFGDEVDRFITFTIPADYSGAIGHQVDSPLVLGWQSQGASEYGVLAGTINLANNGGVLLRDRVSGEFSQLNDGLPVNWKQVNFRALASGTGNFMVGALSGGETMDTELKGLWVHRGGMWSRVAEDLFTSSVVITEVAVSPASNDVFIVGTSRLGLYVTRDGGQTFSNFREELDPSYAEIPTLFNVMALHFDASRILAYVDNFGLFMSTDNGVSFTRSPLLVEDNLDLAEPAMVLPGEVYGFALDPSDSDRILVGLKANGTWESTDGGSSWHDLYGDLNVPADPSDPLYEAGLWEYSALSLAIDSGDPQVIVALLRREGIYRTPDGGVTWSKVGENVDPENINSLLGGYVVAVPGEAGHFLVMEDGNLLAESTDGGLTWAEVSIPPFISTSTTHGLDENGNLLMGTYGGGVYELGPDDVGPSIYLSDTYNNTTSSFLRDLDLGLDVTFGRGDVEANDTFNLVAQTFQGWAVWRAPGYDRSLMTLLGLFDRVNPESCIEGYCGDESYDLVPQCYISKRAACFTFANAPEGSSAPDTVRFFDDEVYNGFSYFYAVTTFDYGNTALLSAENNTNTMIFSPRFSSDGMSPFPGSGNSTRAQVNTPVEADDSAEPIYVYPNPLRRGEGLPGAEGETVVFTNLPAESRVRIFTTAGDDVINLGWDNMRNGNIYWSTVNRDGEDVSPGVYLYKVESPARDDYWGRLVIIR